MKKRANPRPTTDDTFLQRICKALDLTPEQLAERIDRRYDDEIAPLLDHKWMVAELDADPVWWDVSKLIDERIALLLAARSEMQKALQKDRQRRVARHAAMQARKPRRIERG